MQLIEDSVAIEDSCGCKGLPSEWRGRRYDVISSRPDPVTFVPQEGTIDKTHSNRS
jgi:hypothetical protein